MITEVKMSKNKLRISNMGMTDHIHSYNAMFVKRVNVHNPQSKSPRVKFPSGQNPSTSLDQAKALSMRVSIFLILIHNFYHTTCWRRIVRDPCMLYT